MLKFVSLEVVHAYCHVPLVGQFIHWKICAILIQSGPGETDITEQLSSATRKSGVATPPFPPTALGMNGRKIWKMCYASWDFFPVEQEFVAGYCALAGIITCILQKEYSQWVDTFQWVKGSP